LRDEPVDLKVAFKKGDLHGKIPFSLEIQEVGTRTPGKVAGGMQGFTDTGKAPLFDLIGTPAKHDCTMDFGAGDELEVGLKNLRTEAIRYLCLDPLPWHRAPIPGHAYLLHARMGQLITSRFWAKAKLSTNH